MKFVKEDEIRTELSIITEPDLGKSLGELNAIRKIAINDDFIQVYIDLVQPILWVAEKINTACSEVLGKIAPDYENELVFSELTANDPKRDILPLVKNIIAVASGKGGVGKSAVAANLAAALSLRGAKVGILDGDVYGPSQPTMFGLTDEPFKVLQTETGENIAVPSEKYGIKIASMGFMLSKDEAAIVRGPMLAGYFSMLFEQLEWGPLDFLIFDLPPGTGDIQLTMTQKIPLTGAVIVTTPQEISVADVRRSIAMFRKVDVPILGIIENMSYFIPPDLPDKKYYIFGKDGGKNIATESGIPFLGEIPLDIDMRETNDGGKPLILAKDYGNQRDIIIKIASELITQVRMQNYINQLNPLTEIQI